MAHTTCTHPDADALHTPACGQPQQWSCETIGGCGDTFVITKPCAVFRLTSHEAGCGHRSLPAAWCGCETVCTVACADCGKEYPSDVQTGPGVDVYA